jgi:hypothetical protein
MMTIDLAVLCAFLLSGAPMDTENHYAAPITGEGRIEIDPVPGGKLFQGTWLVTSGTRYVLGYRPMPELLKYVNKRVAFSGRPYRPGRDVQHIMAEHLALDHVTFAAGETPWAEEPTDVPPPPAVRSRKDAEASGSWVRVVAVLEAVGDGEYWVKARLRFEDGSTIDAPSVRKEEWAPLAKKLCSVVGQVRPEHEPDALALSPPPPGPKVLFAVAICEGDVERCGMSERPKAKATKK